MIKRPYMMFLSYAIAVMAAFWLGFSAFYVNALNHRPVAVAAVRTTHLAGHAAATQGTALRPVTTRVS